MKTFMVGLALSAALVTGAAEAATVSFSGSSTGDDFTVGRFDTGLGTLTGVNLRLNASTDGKRFVFADDGETKSFTVAIAVAFAGLDFMDEVTESKTCEIFADDFECRLDFDLFASINFDRLIFPDLNLVSGVGPGTVPVEVSALTGDEGSVDAELTVTYTFDPVVPVPLPAAGGLMLAGLGGLALLRRGARSAPKAARS